MNKELKKILNKNSTALENSARDFCALYSIMFNQDAILAEDNDGFRIRTYSYAQTRERIEEASCALYEKIGATHGFVAVDMENSVDWIVALIYAFITMGVGATFYEHFSYDYYSYEYTYGFGFFLGFTIVLAIIELIIGIVAVILSSAARNRGSKSGMAGAGKALGIVTIILSVVSFFIALMAAGLYA